MSVLKELIRVGRISDYAEPSEERHLRNRANVLFAYVLVLWSVAYYRARLHYLPGSLQALLLLLGILLAFATLYGALLQMWFRRKTGSRRPLWMALRVQQGTAALVLMGTFVIFLVRAVIHFDMTALLLASVILMALSWG